MDTPTLILGAILELVALVAMVRLWMRRPLRIVSSALWSVVLLVPFFGLVIYFFLREKPEAHGESVPESYGGSSYGDGGGHGGGDGH